MGQSSLKKYRTIFISDVHLGTKDCKAELLNNFLKHNSCEKLYLVGDIIDGWKVQQNRLRWKQSHSNVLRRILGFSKHGSQVIYVAGNHDEFLRTFIPYGIGLGNIVICNHIEHIGVDGKHYLVVHGDMFDGVTRLHKWISFLGDRAYDVVLRLNSKFNWIRRKLGFGYWSLSKYLKHRVKKAVDFIFQFEKNVSLYCKKKGYDGVICGHIHHAEIKEIDGIIYMNDGDWVESCTALVEHYNGKWEIITWGEMYESKKTINENVSSDTKERQRERKEVVVQGFE
jgi:UDP-2,3-diacylglucosamine pyrophosphatase LpxH